MTFLQKLFPIGIVIGIVIYFIIKFARWWNR